MQYLTNNGWKYPTEINDDDLVFVFKNEKLQLIPSNCLSKSIKRVDYLYKVINNTSNYCCYLYDNALLYNNDSKSSVNVKMDHYYNNKHVYNYSIISQWPVVVPNGEHVDLKHIHLNVKRQIITTDLIDSDINHCPTFLSMWKETYGDLIACDYNQSIKLSMIAACCGFGCQIDNKSGFVVNLMNKQLSQIDNIVKVNTSVKIGHYVLDDQIVHPIALYKSQIFIQ